MASPCAGAWQTGSLTAHLLDQNDNRDFSENPELEQNPQVPERRSAVRQSPRGVGDTGVIDVDGRSIPVLVADSSVAGIGVVAVNWPGTSIGATVVFQSNARSTESRVASVRHVTLAGTRVFRIGLEWID